jgi:hypothetical protein
MRRLAILAAGAALFGAASAQAGDVITFPQIGGGLTVGSVFQPGTGSLTRFNDTAAAGVGVDGPFVSVSGSTPSNGNEALGTDARLNWDFEVQGPPTGQVNVVITGTYEASVTSATGGAVGNVFVGDGLFDLTDYFHAECDAGNRGQCAQRTFSVTVPVLVNNLNVIEIQAGGGNGVFSASIDPTISLATGLADEGYTLQVEPDALPTTGGAGGVPEPATWALLILGFGAVGAAARRRRLTPSTPAARPA